MFRRRLSRGPIDKAPRAPTKEEVPGTPLNQAARQIQQYRNNLGSDLIGRDEPKNTYENSTVKESYHISVFHNQEESNLFEHSPIFVNGPATASTQSDVISALGLPMINHYLELSVRDKQEAPRQLPGSLRKRNNNLDQFYTYSVEEFAQKWSFLGSLNEPPELARNYSEGGIIKPSLHPKIGVDVSGVVTLKQQFAQEVSTGDHLYWIVKPVVSPYKCFYGWKGESLGSRTPSDTSFLQVFGFSDKDTVIPFPNTSNSERDTPQLRDRCGIAKNVAIKQHYSIVEYDPINGINIRPGEDVDVPDLIVDMYTEGYVIPVGIVQTVDAAPVSRDRLLISHRDIEKQSTLPTVSVVRST